MIEGPKPTDKEQPLIDKFIKKMASKGITIEDDTATTSDGRPLYNKVITGNGKTIRMSHHSFYRHTGMCKAMKKRPGSKDEYDYVPFTYEMWLNTIIEPIIMVRLGILKMDKK